MDYNGIMIDSYDISYEGFLKLAVALNLRLRFSIVNHPVLDIPMHWKPANDAYSASLFLVKPWHAHPGSSGEWLVCLMLMMKISEMPPRTNGFLRGVIYTIYHF